MFSEYLDIYRIIYYTHSSLKLKESLNVKRQVLMLSNLSILKRIFAGVNVSVKLTVGVNI